jgi:hypothetical protein
VARFRLRDADIKAISLVKRGANGRRIFLCKAEEERRLKCPKCSTVQPASNAKCAKCGHDLTDARKAKFAQMAKEELHAPTKIIKSSEQPDWSTFYVVVAEPDRAEGGGLFAPEDEDVWSAEEIVKAAHRFVANGGLLNHEHKDLLDGTEFEQYGALAESAVALDDLEVNGEKIAKGSWYIGVNPNDEGRALIDSGEITGVSIQGLAVREPVEVVKTDVAEAQADVTLRNKIAGWFGFPPSGTTSYTINATNSSGSGFGGHATLESIDSPEDEVDEAKVTEIVKAQVTEAVNPLAETLAELKTGLATLTQRVPEPEPEKPTPEDIAKSLKAVADAVLDLDKKVEALGDDGSAQTEDGERKPVAKSDKPLRGLLD